MAKQKKKRNKVYRGSDARQTRPTIQRISAEDRGPVKEWIHNRRKFAKPLAFLFGAIAFVALIITAIVGIINL